MGIFRRGDRLGATAGKRYKILILAEDGETLWWHKRGELHVVDEDVARIFVANFKPELFGVAPDGSLQPPEPGKTKPIRSVDMRPVQT